MPVLSKIIINDSNNNYVTKSIKNYLINNPNYKGIIYIDYKNRIYTQHTNFIPQKFINKIIYISSTSFQQNNIKLANKIRLFVINNINSSKDLLCIGGESYMYSLILNSNISYHYTNSKSIYDDCNKNNNKIINNLVDYNKIINLPNTNYCIINLSTLNKNLLLELNKNIYSKIIIISCHHDDFWKKIQYLSNYKIINRKKFICDTLKYFITVNILIYKNNYISLGGNCSVAYNLNRLNLRNKAYPFDWCKISIKQLVNVLSNNFKDFDKVEVVKLSSNHLDFDTNKETYILKNKYNITFAHEILEKYQMNIFQNKLLFRMNNFIQLKNPIFVRLEQNKVSIKDIDSLINELDKYFRNYKIIIISKYDIFIENPNIVIIKLDTDYIDWKYSNFNWNKIT